VVEQNAIHEHVTGDLEVRRLRTSSVR
jgi:hypothetical protein